MQIKKGLIFSAFLLASATGVANADEPVKFGSWSVSCGVDKLTDRKQCSLDQRIEIPGGGKTIFVALSVFKNSATGKDEVMVFSTAIDPRKPVHMRIGLNPVKSSSDYVDGRDGVLFADGESIVSEMRKSSSLFVRLTDVHSGATYDANFNLRDFPEAIEYFNSLKP